MAAVDSPITKQVTKDAREVGTLHAHICLGDAADRLIYDRHGISFPFKKLYQDRKSVIIFVRNFLCYSCKEYVEDLSKVPEEVLKPFCTLTGYPYEMYVDPERCIYHELGMKSEEKFTKSAKPSPHVKSGIIMGQIKSIWRAMTSPIFDFQGDLQQQGGAIIAGPGTKVHFCHFDSNYLDHMPINWLLQLAGVKQTLDFSNKSKIIHV
ncbi:peroxiredoxin-like 2C isoform X2 [Brachionichthys hirsutus]|uniref:peroxiredoxin-like 2C isoform X2 n=1 Tax=Brachionichthys hirsutus TaxID=412623 RepID=UPI003604CED1